MICPHCKNQISDTEVAHYFASKGGRSTSEAKRAASRRNAKLGGRPKKKKEKKR